MLTKNFNFTCKLILLCRQNSKIVQNFVGESVISVFSAAICSHPQKIYQRSKTEVISKDKARNFVPYWNHLLRIDTQMLQLKISSWINTGFICKAETSGFSRLIIWWEYGNMLSLKQDTIGINFQTEMHCISKFTLFNSSFDQHSSRQPGRNLCSLINKQ